MMLVGLPLYFLLPVSSEGKQELVFIMHNYN